MTKKVTRIDKTVDLRKQAEKINRGKAAQSPENIDKMSSAQLKRTLHELRIHQIELEMQNEELRRTQAEVDTARARFFDFYDLAPVGYFTLSEKGLIIEANLTAATMLGEARSKLVKKLLFRFVLKEDQHIYFLQFNQIFGSGEPQACELRMLKKDGPEFWARLEAIAAKDTDGATTCRIVISDITERKRAEEELKLFKAITEKSGESIAISNSKGRLIYINPSHEKLFGRSLTEAQNLNFRYYYPPESIEILNSVVAPALERGQGWEGELDVYDATGRKFPLWEMADSLLDDKGQLLYGFGFMHDITKRKRMENELRESHDLLESCVEERTGQLRESEEKYRRITENMGDVVLELDGQGKIKYVSPSNQKLFGKKTESRIGRSAFEDIHPEDMDRVMAQYMEGIRTEKGSAAEYRCRHADGHYIWIRSVGRGLYDDAGQLSSVIIAGSDITERKQAESQSEAVLEALQKSEANYRQLFDNSPAGIYQIDFRTGKILKANSVICEYFGCSQEEVASMNLNDILTNERRTKPLRGSHPIAFFHGQKIHQSL